MPVNRKRVGEGSNRSRGQLAGIAARAEKRAVPRRPPDAGGLPLWRHKRQRPPSSLFPRAMCNSPRREERTSHPLDLLVLSVLLVLSGPVESLLPTSGAALHFPN